VPCGVFSVAILKRRDAKGTAGLGKEKTEKRRTKEPKFSRRDFNRIAATFGVTSTLLAFKGLAQAGERPSATQLAQAGKDHAEVHAPIRSGGP
jgi:hypothetical protein